MCNLLYTPYKTIDGHVGTREDIRYARNDAEFTTQLAVDSHIYYGSSSSLLYSICFENALSCSGQNFPLMKDFRDVVYFLSIGCRFRYKFKRNSFKHKSVVCNFNGCPWKVTINDIGAIQMVQVFGFKDMHNHLVDDVTFHKLVISTKHGGALVDDVIKGTLDYLPRLLCKDFEGQCGMHMSYAQAWNMKEKSKERIHGMPQFSYKLLPWMRQCLIELNPRTITEYRCDPEIHFLFMFFALIVSMHRFKMGCWPIIFDSSHMSGPFKGVIFSASMYDANDGLFPLTYILLMSENYKDRL